MDDHHEWRVVGASACPGKVGTGFPTRTCAKSSAEHFDVFVTVDRNLSFQQNLVSLPIAVVVLQAKTNRLADLRPLVPKLLAAIASAPPGTATFIEAG